MFDINEELERKTFLTLYSLVTFRLAKLDFRVPSGFIFFGIIDVFFQSFIVPLMCSTSTNVEIIKYGNNSEKKIKVLINIIPKSIQYQTTSFRVGYLCH